MLAVPTRLGPFLRSRLFSWPGKLRMGLDLAAAARRRPPRTSRSRPSCGAVSAGRRWSGWASR